MRRIAVVGLIIAAFVLSGCGGGGYTASEVASLMEAQKGTRNVICKHRDVDRASVVRCRAHSRSARRGNDGRNRRLWKAGHLVLQCGALD